MVACQDGNLKNNRYVAARRSLTKASERITVVPRTKHFHSIPRFACCRGYLRELMHLSSVQVKAFMHRTGCHTISYRSHKTTKIQSSCGQRPHQSRLGSSSCNLYTRTSSSSNGTQRRAQGGRIQKFGLVLASCHGSWSARRLLEPAERRTCMN